MLIAKKKEHSLKAILCSQHAQLDLTMMVQLFFDLVVVSCLVSLVGEGPERDHGSSVCRLDHGSWTT